MTIATKLDMRLSGGAANTDVTQSLGGIVSSTAVVGQYVTGNALTGITFTKASGNPLGDDVVTFLHSSSDGKQRTDLKIVDNATINAGQGFSVKVDSTNYTFTAAVSENETAILTSIRNQINADSGAPCTATGPTTSGGYTYITLTGKTANTPFTVAKGAYDPYWWNPSSVGWGVLVVTTKLPSPDFGTDSAIEWKGGYANFGTDGSYRVKGTSNEILFFDVVYASLPGADTSDTITINLDPNETFANIAADDMYYGVDLYHCFYFKNTDTISHDVTFWIAQQPTGNSVLYVGLDPAGVGDGVSTGVAATVASERIPPTSVTFSQPSDEVSGIELGTLTAGQTYPFWIKVHVDPGTYAATNPSLSAIGYVVY